MSTLSYQNKSRPCKGEIPFFRSWNPLSLAWNFKLKFQFQTLLARNSPVGTSELLPFGINWDLTWDWISTEIHLRDFSLFYLLGFTRLLLSGENTSIHQKYKIAYVTIDPVADYVYITDLILELCVGWKTLPNGFVLFPSRLLCIRLTLPNLLRVVSWYLLESWLTIRCPFALRWEAWAPPLPSDCSHRDPPLHYSDMLSLFAPSCTCHYPLVLLIPPPHGWRQWGVALEVWCTYAWSFHGRGCPARYTGGLMFEVGWHMFLNQVSESWSENYQVGYQDPKRG